MKMPFTIRQMTAGLIAVFLLTLSPGRVFADESAPEEAPVYHEADTGVVGDAELTVVDQTTVTESSSEPEQTPPDYPSDQTPDQVIGQSNSENSTESSTNNNDELPPAPEIQEPPVCPTAEQNPATEEQPAVDANPEQEGLQMEEARPEGLQMPESEDQNQAVPAQNQTGVDLTNCNDANVDNTTLVSAQTGENVIEAEEDVEKSVIASGDVNVYANILNVLNLNLTNSDIVALSQEFNNLSNDIILGVGQGIPSTAGLAQDLVDGMCGGEVECQSLTSFKLTNINTANLNNTVGVVGDSGNNSIAAGEDVEESAIATGNVNAVVNILNIVNANLVNSTWTIMSFNVFGDWTGDLVLPEELYFAEHMTVGVLTGTDQQLVEKAVVNLANYNEAEINNNVAVGVETGANGIEGGEDVEESAIATGGSQAVANVENIVNTTVVNGQWFLVLANVLGTWAGDVYSLPDQVYMEQTGGGYSFFATSANSSQAAAAFQESVSEQETEIDVTNSNDATINNNVAVGANTGTNSIAAGEDVEKSAILTGNAKALVNLLNFANTNLINADLFVGLVNVFGNWHGNIMFGYPDAAVSQSLESEYYPAASGYGVHYGIQVANGARTSSQKNHLHWFFDPTIATVTDVNSPFTYTQTEPGVLDFDLGRLGPLSSNTIDVTLATTTDLNDGADVQTGAQVSGGTPEKNTGNNSHLLTVAAHDIQTANNDDDGPLTTVPVKPAAAEQLYDPAAATQLDYFRIYKTNDKIATELVTGDSITFTITIDNDSYEKTLASVAVVDEIVDAAGNVLKTQHFDIGAMAPRAEVKITYTLPIIAGIIPGAYTNQAFAYGKLGSLTVLTLERAESDFTVGGQTEELLPLFPAVIEEEPPTPPVIAKHVRPSSGNKGGIAGTLTQVADVLSGSEPIVPTAQAVFEESGVQAGGLSQQWINILILVFLISFGYALASSRQKIWPVVRKIGHSFHIF